jgi:ribosomal protein L37AE/L43A
MTLQPSTRGIPKAISFAKITGNFCPQCGDRLLAPEWSEHVSERCVRHVWTCDACTYSFESAVYLEAT